MLRSDLGWTDFKRVEYFGGYVSLSFFASPTVPPLEVQWQRVTDFMAHALPLFRRVYIWSRVQTIGGLDDGTTGNSSWLPTDLAFRAPDAGGLWFADGGGGSFICARSGYRAPLRLKKTVGGRDYIRKFAPRDGEKER